MSLKVEYHKPAFESELASRRIASSLVFPTDPRRRKPEINTSMAARLFTRGMTNTGLLAFTDCRVVPLQGAAVLHPGSDPLGAAEAPIPIIRSPLRKVICFTL